MFPIKSTGIINLQSWSFASKNAALELSRTLEHMILRYSIDVEVSSVFQEFEAKYTGFYCQDLVFFSFLNSKSFSLQCLTTTQSELYVCPACRLLIPCVVRFSFLWKHFFTDFDNRAKRPDLERQTFNLALQLG